MVDWIAAVVVLVIFAVTALLVTLVVWGADPVQFARWIGAVRSGGVRRWISKPRSDGFARLVQRRFRPIGFARLRTTAVTNDVPPPAGMRPAAPEEPSAARLQYWLRLEDRD
jgi:hypothetical protein